MTKEFRDINMSKKMLIGLISIRGLPASYGAFEQTSSQLAEYLEDHHPNITLYVGCTSDVYNQPIDHNNVVRKAFSRSGGLGTVLYGLKTVMWCLKSRCKVIIVFGYALAPFFLFFQLLGIRVICNVDGIEWRRDKWGSLAKLYFKFCEKMAVLSNADLIFDSFNIERYYRIKHSRKGHLIFYGSESFDEDVLKSAFADIKNDYQIEVGSYYTCVMRLEPENNIKIIVQGFIKSGITKKLLIIGPSTQYFEKEILPLIIEHKYISWIGPIYNRPTLMALRKNAFAHVHGHKVGGTNPTLVEALHLRSKVFAYNSIFNQEIVHKKCLFSSADELSMLLRSDDPQELVVNDPKLYTWQYVCGEYAKLMEKQ